MSREALVAFDMDGCGVAIARYESLSGGTAAEFAVAVDPAWRRIGLATVLLTRLLRAALKQGIRTVHVDYFANNNDVADLVRRTGQAYSKSVDCGVVDADVTIDSDLLEEQARAVTP